MERRNTALSSGTEMERSVFLGGFKSLKVSISLFPRAFGGTTPPVPLKLTLSAKFEGFPLRIAPQKTEESDL